MKKKLSLILCAVLFSSANATEESKSLADVTIKSGVTNVYVNKITGAKIETTPITWMDTKIKLNLGGFSPSFGYSRTFVANSSSEAGSKTFKDNTSERIIISIPFDKIGLEGWKANYSKYTFNSYLTALDGREVWMVDKTNTHAKTGTIPIPDQGLSYATPGETLGLTIESERAELLKYLKGREFAGNPAVYFGMFAERLYKPWEDPTTTWYHNGVPVTLVYSQAEFLTYGITMGSKLEDIDLPTGFSIKSIGLDIGISDIQLTDNYAFSEELGENQQIYKVGFKTELAYKIPTTFLGSKSALIFETFANYDYYYLDTDTTSNSNNSIDLSDDFLVGASVGINF